MTLFFPGNNGSLMLLMGFLFAIFEMTGAQPIGACYGMLGNNLPPAQEVINLYKSNNIVATRLFDPNQAALQALRDSGIITMVGVPNTDLQNLATNPASANDWIQNNVINYYPQVNFRYIAVGNEIRPVNDATSWMAQFVLPAMQNIQNAISSFNLQNTIKVSTAIDMTLLGNSYPPSAGRFRDDVMWYFDPIIRFLVANNAPLLANVYPYFAYIGNPRDISLDYALFTAPGVVVWDNGLGYQNLFDAMVDAIYAALERVGAGSLEIVVSETGWPSAGGDATTVENAYNYYSRVVQHVQNGTPRRPQNLDTYLFATFDENNKNPEYEKHFGLFFPDKRPKFPLRGAMERLGDVYAENSTSLVSPKSDI